MAGDEAPATRAGTQEDDGHDEMFWKVPLPSESSHFVDSTEADSFACLVLALERAAMIAMDAEWKPLLHGSGSVGAQHPRVSILQIACRLQSGSGSQSSVLKSLQEPKSDTLRRDDRTSWGEDRSEKEIKCGTSLDEMNTSCCDMIFLLDLLTLPASAFSKVLKSVLVNPAVLKLGFGFKQDLLHLQETFPGPDSHGCFDKVEPYLDVGKLFRHLHASHSTLMSRGRRIIIGGEYSLTCISDKVLGLPLSKDMQCSNWEQRPLSKRQFQYAAADAYCLLMIFDVLQVEASESWFSPNVDGNDNEDGLWNRSNVGVAGLLAPGNGAVAGIGDKYSVDGICQPKRGDAAAMVQAALGEACFSGLGRDGGDLRKLEANVIVSKSLGIETLVHRFGEKLLVIGGAVTSNRKTRKTRSRRAKEAGPNRGLQDEREFDYVGPPPWDTAVGGDGLPKFLCDAMVEGLARQLRCVGIDAASPNSRKCEPRELVDLAEREGRIILTRDVKLLRRKLVPRELTYRVKRQGKWDQLAEIIETFKLTIREDQILTRCTKCNGRFIQKAMTAKEAATQGPWNQVIPEWVLKELDEFWQCSICKHLYWQGSVFSRAFEQFIAVCQEGKIVDHGLKANLGSLGP